MEILIVRALAEIKRAGSNEPALFISTTLYSVGAIIPRKLFS